jgi:hypothetical protein
MSNWGALFGISWKTFLIRVGPIAENRDFIRLEALFQEYNEEFIETLLAVIIHPTAAKVFENARYRTTIERAYPHKITALTKAMAACRILDGTQERLPGYDELFN